MGELSQFRSHGDRKIEIVRAKMFNANQSWLAPSSCPPPFVGSSMASNGCKRKSTSISKSWAFNNAESKRRRRVASYKAYAMEGKVRASLRNGIRWIKEKCSDFIRG